MSRSLSCADEVGGDAGYVALAEAVTDEPVPLLTADARLARAITAHRDVPMLLAD